MATVNFYLKSPDTSGNSLISLYFRFTENKVKQQVVLSTNETIPLKHWDKENQKVKRTFTGYSDINNNLEKVSEDVNSVYRTLCNSKPRITITPELIKDQVLILNNKKETKTQVNLFGFLDSYIKSVDSIKKKATLKGYRNTFGHLKDFSGGKKIDFNSIDLDFYNDFIEYLKRKGFATNTIGKQIKNLKAFLNEATERGYNTRLDYKSKRFKVVMEEADTIYLSELEIKKLIKHDFSDQPRLEKVRDLFVVGCYTGLRFSDFSQIQSENLRDGMFHIRTQKTNETVVIPLHPLVSSIIKKYQKQHQMFLPKALSNQKMNEYLKEIGKLVKIKDKVVITRNKGTTRVVTTYFKYDLITTHTARRSFATNLYLLDFPAISIMKITGHQTERAFMKYIKVTQEQVASKLKLFWSKKNRLLKAV